MCVHVEVGVDSHKM